MQHASNASYAALVGEVKTRPRLTDCGSALEALLALLPTSISSRRLPIAAAVGRVLAETLTARAAVPPAPVAAVDGWALVAAHTQGSGPYNPAPLPPNTPRASEPTTHQAPTRSSDERHLRLRFGSRRL